MLCPHCSKPIPNRLPQVKIDAVITLHKQDYSLRDIQYKTGVSFSSAGRIIRKYKGNK